jgi:hypothetical protein
LCFAGCSRCLICLMPVICFVRLVLVLYNNFVFVNYSPILTFLYIKYYLLSGLICKQLELDKMIKQAIVLIKTWEKLDLHSTPEHSINYQFILKMQMFSNKDKSSH